MKIPSGYHRLRTGAEVKNGDMIPVCTKKGWYAIQNQDCQVPVRKGEIIIRKRKARRAKK